MEMKKVEECQKNADPMGAEIRGIFIYNDNNLVQLCIVIVLICDNLRQHRRHLVSHKK